MSALADTRIIRNNRDAVTGESDVSGDSERIPFMPWEEFIPRFQWRQGEHVAMIAATQSGKTTLARAILPLRRYVVMLATKNKDPVIDEFRRDGYIVQREWTPIPVAYPRVILKPPLEDADHMDDQRQAFKACLHDAFRSGGWTIYADEVRYLTQNLQLQHQMELLWLQAASAKSSIVALTQRPAWVPLELYNASTHIFLWSENDHRNLKRLSELDGANTDLIRWQLPRLRDYEALYVCTRKHQGLSMVRTMAPKGR